MHPGSMLLSLLLAASASSATPAASVTQLHWLQGCWERSADGRAVEEHWLSPRAGSMLGIGRTTRDGVLVEYEFMAILERDGALVFRAHPSGQATTEFIARESGADGVVFENLAHDFPQRVGYRRDGADALLAWIEGTADGKARRIEFPYRRVDCAGR
jgi:Domain of unknown function (DUF6265)